MSKLNKFDLYMLMSAVLIGVGCGLLLEGIANSDFVFLDFELEVFMILLGIVGIDVTYRNRDVLR